jgi:hypothetical protein
MQVKPVADALLKTRKIGGVYAARRHAPHGLPIGKRRFGGSKAWP